MAKRVTGREWWVILAFIAIFASNLIIGVLSWSGHDERYEQIEKNNQRVHQENEELKQQLRNYSNANLEK